MKRTKSIKVRLTPEELAQLRRLVGRSDLSGYIRTKAFGIDQPKENSERLILISEMARARHALNQIARLIEQRALVEQIEIVAALLAVERRIGARK